jgi:predicted MFS family arabinose efflux permease
MSEFNKLWVGQTVSLVGTVLTGFALPTLAILTLHASASQVGVLVALETLPFPILGMIVGVLADRFSRRKIMIVSDIVRFVALATIPIAAVFGALHMPQLYAVSLVTGCASAFFGISYQAYLPVVVSVDRLTDANMKLEFSNSGSDMLGKALAGALVQWLGAAAAIGIDALSYVISVLSLAWIRVSEPPHDGPALSLRQGFRELREGFDVVFRSPDLRWILGATATVNFGGSMMTAVMFIYAYRILHLQPGLLGLVFAFANSGFVGALFAERVRKRLGLRVTLIAALLVAALADAGWLLAQLALPYVTLLIVCSIQALTIPIYNVNQISYRQALVDVRLQGRMNATMRTFVWGTMPLGALVGGYAGVLIGVQATIVIGAVLSALAALWLLPLRERNVSAPATEVA